MLEGFLSTATRTKLKPVASDLVTLEVQMGRSLGSVEGKAYAGLRDDEIPFVLEEEYVRPTADFPLPYYLGASPVGVLSQFLQGQKASDPDEQGYAPLPGGFLSNKEVWLRKHGGFVTLGSQKQVLEEVTPGLEVVPAEWPAQIRLRVADLGASKAAPLLQAQSFLLDRSTGDANESLLHRLAQQLGVKPEEAMDVASRLLGAKLVCPFGGAYELQEERRGGARTGFSAWRSTAFRTEGTWSRIDAVPGGYESAVLKRFHGLELEFRLSEGTLYSRTELEQDRVGK